MNTLTQEKNLYILYADSDENFAKEIAKYLTPLLSRYSMKALHKANLLSGDDQESQIQAFLRKSQIIVVLLSADFFVCERCQQELQYAKKFIRVKETFIVPVLVKECMWELSEFSKFKTLPKNGIPVESWNLVSKAYTEIVKGIDEIARHLLKTVNNQSFNSHIKAVHRSNIPVISDKKRLEQLVLEDKVEQALMEARQSTNNEEIINGLKKLYELQHQQTGIVDYESRIAVTNRIRQTVLQALAEDENPNLSQRQAL